jgi:hypothetical protein
VLDPSKPYILYIAGTMKVGAVTADVLEVANAKARAGDRCAIVRSGDCYSIDCSSSLPGPIAGALAGTLSLEGGIAARKTLRPDPATGWYPALFDFETPKWPPGTALKFSAAGGPDIPAFTLEGKMPAQPELTSPQFPATGTLTVDRSHSLDFTWNNGSGWFYAEILQTTNGDHSIPGEARDVYCTFDPAKGQGSIPAKALSFFSTDAATTSTVFFIGNGDQGNTNIVDGYNIVQGGYPVQIGFVNAVGGAITFQ